MNTIFQAKATGRVLFEQVCKQLSLLEADYFGLEYQDGPGGAKYWLDLEKPLNRQVGLSLVDPMLRFCIKFYTPDPCQLEEEYTRYLFCLQIKRDLSTGNLQCSDNTAALMASYIVQGIHYYNSSTKKLVTYPIYFFQEFLIKSLFFLFAIAPSLFL